VRVELCGVRGSTPAPGIDFAGFGGHTSCVALGHGDAPPSLLLDAGTGIRAATALLDGGPFRGTLLLTHLHWDHMQGLPFFASADSESSEVELLVPAQADGGDAAQLLARAMSPPFFPARPEDLRGSWRFAAIEPGEHRIGGFTVVAAEIPHKGGRTFGYRISDRGATLTYMPDHCPTALGPGADGLGEYHEAALALAAGSDLLVHDAQLLLSELATDAPMGHSCGEYAVELARRAGCRAVLLFHHRPDRVDSALAALETRFTGSPPVAVARQGSTISL